MSLSERGVATTLTHWAFYSEVTEVLIGEGLEVISIEAGQKAAAEDEANSRSRDEVMQDEGNLVENEKFSRLVERLTKPLCPNPQLQSRAHVVGCHARTSKYQGEAMHTSPCQVFWRA